MNKAVFTTVALLSVVVLAIITMPSESIVGIDTVADYENSFELHGERLTVVLDDKGREVSRHLDSNLITTVGLNHIKYLVGEGQGTNAMKYIALGNGTDPEAGSTELSGEWASCGLSRATGNYYSNGDGNWTISASFTANEDGCKVNTTAVFNDTSGAMMFAGDTYSSTDTLNTNYVLQQNWTFWVT